MVAYTFLTLAYIFCQLDSSQQCSFYPIVPPYKTIYCSGVEIVALPTVDIETATAIGEIYIHATSITCMDSRDAWMYDNLRVFGEQGNAYWNCSCMQKWLDENNGSVDVSSECLGWHTTTTAEFSTGVIESETIYATTEVDTSNSTLIEEEEEKEEMTRSTVAAIAATGSLLLVIAPLGAIVVRRKLRAPACRYPRCAGCCRRSVGIEQAVTNANWRLSLDEISLDEFVQGVSEV